jgi:hypothetical protein
MTGETGEKGKRSKTGEFVITLRAPRGMGEAEAIRMIRGVLKVALRRFRLRCIRLQPGKPTPPDS